MTTLEEFVRDGVVKDCPNDRGVQSLRIDAGYGFVLLEGNELLVQDPTSDGAVVNMTPTQLRALSAMALWAAERAEVKAGPASMMKSLDYGNGVELNRGAIDLRMGELSQQQGAAEQMEKKQ